MKKSLLIVSLIAAMSIAACSKKEEAQPTETTAAPAETMQHNQEAAPAAPAAPQANETAPEAAHQPTDAAHPEKKKQ